MIDPFVDHAWLHRHREGVVLADVRWYSDGRPGWPAFEAGHLPAAVFIDLDRVLSAAPSDAGGRHPLPSPEVFADGLSAAGIGDGDVVVAYDDDGGVIAARLVWMLRAIGHQAALLDGGMRVWTGALETGPGSRRPRRFTPAPWPASLLVEIEEVAATDAVLIDARPAGRYGGEPDRLDPRAGHIPGARSVPTREHNDPDGRIAAPDALRERFAAAGIEHGTEVISYCGSGVTACHNLLALERAGLGPGRLFVGSWSQWSRDPDRPVETSDPS